jgi:Tfp pilus assembly protein PilX
MSKSSTNLHSQSGGITILVTLMLLVLLTIVAVNMSRNSFREVIISGTTRQGAMTRNLADSGIEWSILYSDPVHYPGVTTSGTAMQSLASTLLAGNIFGVPYDVHTQAAITTLPNTASVPSDLQVPAGSGNGVNLALTCMGKMPQTMTTQTAGTPGTGNTPASGAPSLTAPDLWAVRSDAQVVQGAVTFLHSKEAWISTPTR